jgi:hypothetical protein
VSNGAEDDLGWPSSKDAGAALLLARNCLLYEKDSGPAELNVGTPKVAFRIPRSEAWQLSYAMHLVNDLDGDAARIAAARAECTSRCVRTDLREGAAGRRAWSRAAGLCDEALRMIEGITVAKSPMGPPLLKAVSEHDTMVVALGIVAGIAEDADRDLRDAVRAAGARMSDIPSPEQLVAWAFPWL